LHADLLLFVLDASHPQALQQVDAVYEVLRELDVDEDRIVGVLNKVDAVTDDGELSVLRSRFSQSVTISAVTRVGLDELADVVVGRRSTDWEELQLLVPHDKARLHALVHQHGEVLEEAWEDDGWHARVSVPRRILWQLEGVIAGGCDAGAPPDA
ncbi:MAG: hypothetical protein H6742_19680, partial [Alphaproteobacteria bacterium]|nr:hypothetical protein [Alphaproteobacteria bacterium]